MKWPTADDPGKAVITPTEYGTFGIAWENFEALEARGGWSGPYSSAEEAEEGARVVIESYGLEEGSVLILRAHA